MTVCVVVYAVQTLSEARPPPPSPVGPRAARTATLLSCECVREISPKCSKPSTGLHAATRNFGDVSLSDDGVAPVSGAGKATAREAVKLESTDIVRPLVPRY
jgi:hypothetical protein